MTVFSPVGKVHTGARAKDAAPVVRNGVVVRRYGAARTNPTRKHRVRKEVRAIMRMDGVSEAEARISWGAYRERLASASEADRLEVDAAAIVALTRKIEAKQAARATRAANRAAKLATYSTK